MGSNELVIKPREDLVPVDKYGMFEVIPEVSYSLVDAFRYSFECKYNDNVKVNMFETDRNFEDNEFVDAEFVDEKEEKNTAYYLVAAASGVLTGIISRLNVDIDKLKLIQEWSDRDWENIIIKAAQIAGCKKDDIKAAVSFLKNKVVRCFTEGTETEVKGTLEEIQNYLSSHPSVAGLVFSILTQFANCRFSLDEKNNVKRGKLPEYYAIGENLPEKILYGYLYWVFNLGVDVTLAGLNILDEMKMPAQIKKLLKSICKLKLFNKVPTNYTDCEKLFSEWIKKVFAISIKNGEGEDEKFDIAKLIDRVLEERFTESFPVILNECFVRAFYLIKRFIDEIKEKGVKTLNDFNKIDIEKILPINNRLLSRMHLISSGCFAGINISGAVYKAIKEEKIKGRRFAENLLSEIDIAGVGCFVFAIIGDAKYWPDDFKIFMHRKDKKHKEDEYNEADVIIEDINTYDSSEIFSLSPVQLRVLNSLKSIAIQRDIEHTSSDEDREKKELWHKLWKEGILSGIGIDTYEYFITDEKKIYDAFNQIEQNDDNLRWFYLLSMELIVFKPYYSLGSMYDNRFKKLVRDKYNYIDDQFARRQIIINQAEIDSIRDYYIKYKGIVSGKTQNRIIAAGAVFAAAAATGGLALAFAPGIATMIAGETVVGLHGAALTSASLAFVGGGSLAAGGLGMAGGTAIITGGGVILGLAGSSGASMAVLLSQTDNEYWLRQIVKMLVFSRCVLMDKFANKDAVKCLLAEIERVAETIEKNIKELEEEDCSLDKDSIKKAKENLKYVTRGKAEMSKILE